MSEVKGWLASADVSGLYLQGRIVGIRPSRSFTREDGTEGRSNAVVRVLVGDVIVPVTCRDVELVKDLPTDSMVQLMVKASGPYDAAHKRYAPATDTYRLWSSDVPDGDA